VLMGWLVGALWAWGSWWLAGQYAARNARV